MIIQEEIQIAQKIAEEAHAEDRRRGGEPYMNHIEAVVEKVSDPAKPTAYIHDVMEDHPKMFTPEILRERGLSEETIGAAILLNKNAHEGIDYLTYIKMLRSNPIAREVKLADIAHNFSDNPSEKQIKKYTLALKILK